MPGEDWGEGVDLAGPLTVSQFTTPGSAAIGEAASCVGHGRWAGVACVSDLRNRNDVAQLAPSRSPAPARKLMELSDFSLSHPERGIPRSTTYHRDHFTTPHHPRSLED